MQSNKEAVHGIYGIMQLSLKNFKVRRKSSITINLPSEKPLIRKFINAKSHFNMLSIDLLWLST